MKKSEGREKVDELLARFLKRDRGALARIISLVEDESPEAAKLLERVFTRTGSALTVGVTGPPGVGKSTLVGRMAAAVRRRGPTVGVIAVDPTSSFSGGALLGDRVRMADVAANDGVFIRSMATRGSLGGLSAATHGAADLMDAFGFEWIFLETVGVGQLELDVANSADITLVVLMPESGDAVQAMKAGLMEIGDVFVVNKADRQGADAMVEDISSIFDLTLGSDQPRPPVVKTVATTDEGVGELVELIHRMAQERLASGELERRRVNRLKGRIASMVESEMLKHIWKRGDLDKRVSQVAEQVYRRRTTPYAAAKRILKELK
jgi:LAO/AO transport system kinase